jgi:hypothetical protein
MAPTGQQGNNIGEVTNVATFQQPYPHATLKGQPVRLMALGDVEGKSPAFLYIDENGKAVWESQSQFTVTDQNIQPITRALAGSNR